MAFNNPDGTFNNETGDPPIDVQVPTTGTTVVLPYSDRYVAFMHSATIAALTVNLPTAPSGANASGQFIELYFRSAVTALTLQDHFGNAVTGLTAAAAATSYVFRRIQGAWVRWR
jgi:hypothetical protein